MDREAERQFRANMRSDAIEKAADAMHLAATLAQLRPEEPSYITTINTTCLLRIGRAIAALAVKDCNYGASKSDETRRANLAKKAATIAAWYGLTVSTGGDPRGYTVKLHGDKLPRSGWGDGFGVA